MTPARAVYSYLVQFLVIALLFIARNAHPYESSLGWWTVWGTAVDIACLITLTLLVRREGIRLFDLVGVVRSQLKRDLLLAIPFAIALIVPALVIGTLLQRVFYPSATLGPQLQVMHLPLWASIYSIVVWPVIWTFTEEVTYLGYLFPRLQVMTRSTTWAAVIVLAFWTIQHPALPLIGGDYPIYRAATAFVTVFIQTMLFIWKRRLLPLIITHWIADLSPGITALLFVH
jgi:membrane protease YdiL (CAAX protease family)